MAQILATQCFKPPGIIVIPEEPSLPVECQVGGVLYSSSILKQGELDGIVYATGTRTYMGKTARLVASAQTVSHFQRAVLKIGDYPIVIALVLVVLVFIVALFRGDPWITTLRFVLVLTVASIPVAMPTMLSVTMAVGAQRLAKKDAIVSRLAAIEEMAGIDILCSDKTGTLTLNQLTLGKPFCVGDTAPEALILNAALASRDEDRDPIDLAILTGLKPEQSLDAYRIVHFQPFDPVGKRTEATVETADRDRDILQTLIYLKLSIAGHLTIFVARTKGPFWSIKPARILLSAVLGTQFLATLIAVYGIFMTPIGWGWAGFVWAYALVWFLIEDWVKQRTYGVFNHTQPVYATRGLRRLNQWVSHLPFT